MVRKATHEDKQLVVEILVSAFAPITVKNSINFVVKQDEKRQERMQILMEYLFERSMRYGDVYLSDNHKACLLVKTQHRESISLKSIREDLRLVFKCIGISRVANVLRRQRIVQHYYPKRPHIKPVILGAKNAAICTGTAARLLLKLKVAYQDNTLPIIVDAADEDNVKLYQKFGFRVIGKEENLGFPIYLLQLN